DERAPVARLVVMPEQCEFALRSGVLRGDRAERAVRGLGVAIGVGSAVGLIAGALRRDIHGMMLVVVLQGLWSAGVGGSLLRTPASLKVAQQGSRRPFLLAPFSGLSEPIGKVRPIRARLADQSVIKAEGAGIKILLIQGVRKVLSVCKVLDPRAEYKPALAGAGKFHAGIGDSVSALRIALSIEGIEVLFADQVRVPHQVQITCGKVRHVP